MATIAENLQIIADSTTAIKQAIIDKGGEITGDITTWASAISEISGGGSELKKFTIDYGDFCFENDMTWDDFVNSIYNVKHYVPYIYTYSKITISGNQVYDGNNIPLSTSTSVYNSILATDKIIPNGTYYLYISGGGAGS